MFWICKLSFWLAVLLEQLHNHSHIHWMWRDGACNWPWWIQKRLNLGKLFGFFTHFFLRHRLFASQNYRGIWYFQNVLRFMYAHCTQWMEHFATYLRCWIKPIVKNNLTKALFSIENPINKQTNKKYIGMPFIILFRRFVHSSSEYFCICKCLCVCVSVGLISLLLVSFGCKCRNGKIFWKPKTFMHHFIEIITSSHHTLQNKHLKLRLIYNPFDAVNFTSQTNFQCFIIYFDFMYSKYLFNIEFHKLHRIFLIYVFIFFHI